MTPAEHALELLRSHAELRRNVHAAILSGATGPAKTTLGSESEPSVTLACDSCGKACPPGTLGPDPDPECAGLWCGECVVAGERWREGKE